MANVCAQPRTRRAGPVLHPEFERVIARMRAALVATPNLLPAPALYLGLARILISEAQALETSSLNKGSK